MSRGVRESEGIDGGRLVGNEARAVNVHVAPTTQAGCWKYSSRVSIATASRALRHLLEASDSLKRIVKDLEILAETAAQFRGLFHVEIISLSFRASLYDHMFLYLDYLDVAETPQGRGKSW